MWGVHKVACELGLCSTCVCVYVEQWPNKRSTKPCISI